MVAQVSVSWHLYDMLGAMGLGLLLAIIYDLLRLFLPSAKWVVFVCDVCIFAVAAVWIFSFAISVSKTGIFRWSMAGAALLGYLGYLLLIAPFTIKIRTAIHFVVMLPFKIFRHYILGFVVKCIVQKAKNRPRKEKKIGKKSKKCLIKPANVLYNSN